MQIEHIALALRPRTPWEAMDLGFAMAREWWRAVWSAWLVVYIPVALLLNLLLHDHLLLAWLALWWLKPAFDRVVLHVLGSAVFSEPPRVRDTLRALRQAVTPGLIASLTLYRFDLARSFNLPVWQLERARGGAARQRARVLHRKARSHAVWLTVICAHFELLIAVSLMLFVGMLTPGPYEIEVGWTALFSGVRDLPLWQQALNNLFYAAAVSLIEPFYVAAGFALYLNRRTQLEAWDIELALRSLNARTPPRMAAVGAVLACVMAAALLWQAPYGAMAAGAEPKSARAEIAEILKDKEFDRHKETQRWRYSGRGLGLDEDKSEKKKPGFDWINLAIFIAEVGRAVLWLLAGALIVWLLVLAARYAGLWSAARHAAYRPPDALFGLDIRPESLPADVAAAALALCAAQRLREALSLLYRGALSWLVHERHLTVAAGDTEQDCLRQVSARGEPSIAAYFAQLVSAWQQAAYAGRMPPHAVAEELCAAWRRHFASNAGAA